MSGKYDDILHLPHHVSEKHPRMSAFDRAAQFSPFAALSGYDDAVKETARLTDRKILLPEEQKAAIDRKLALLQARIKERPTVTITCFQADGRKSGGQYVDVMGAVKKLDSVERAVVFADGRIVLIDDIFDIDSRLFGTQADIFPL